jgi:hypothetical protein
VFLFSVCRQKIRGFASHACCCPDLIEALWALHEFHISLHQSAVRLEFGSIVVTPFLIVAGVLRQMMTGTHGWAAKQAM